MQDAYETLFDARASHLRSDVRVVMHGRCDVGSACHSIAVSYADNSAPVKCGRVLRVDDERLLVIRERLVEKILSEINRGAPLEAILGARLDIDCRTDVVNGEIIESDQLVTNASVVMRICELGGLVDDARVVRNRVGVSAENRQRDAAIAVRISELGVRVNRRVEIGERKCKKTLLSVAVATLVVCAG